MLKIHEICNGLGALLPIEISLFIKLKNVKIKKIWRHEKNEIFCMKKNRIFVSIKIEIDSCLPFEMLVSFLHQLFQHFHGAFSTH